MPGETKRYVAFFSTHRSCSIDFRIESFGFFSNGNIRVSAGKNNVDCSKDNSNDFHQVVDGKGNVLSYESLETSEKEKVLADLLIQTALQNIAKQPDIVS